MRGLLLVALVALAGCSSAPPVPQDPAATSDPALMAELELLASFPELRFTTTHGTIRMVLYASWTPQTAQHIGGLAEAGFYDGTIIHRVVDDFVVQGGDPTGTGEGGSGPAGAPDPVPLEIHAGLDFGSGAVGLARWTDDTGDSQWFITEKPALHLSRPRGPTGEVFGAYALFAQVFDGMDTVRRIAAVETVPHLDRPVEDVMLEKAQLLPPPAVDLLGLVPAVHADIQAEGQVGTLELPRIIVAQHPALARFTVPTDEGDCRVAGHMPVVSGNVTVAPWRAVAHDACTFETRIVFRDHGGHSLSVTGEGAVDFEVLPWHDDYAAYAQSPDRASTPDASPPALGAAPAPLGASSPGPSAHGVAGMGTSSRLAPAAR